MNYLSICSGIEAATHAWHPLGWKPLAFAEIEPFPAAVLAHRHPTVPNLGDFTRYDEWPLHTLLNTDLLVGGTPCQAFSVAGLRQSLQDDRGNLTLTLVKLYDLITHLRHLSGRPAPLLVWENVPGVLNTPDNAFGCFLAALAGEDDPLLPPGGRWKNAGYVRGPSRAIAWRILDAQYFGLAQRRRRVFLVAGPRDSFHPEQVLFEQSGLRRDTPPRRETRETITHDLAPCLTSGGRGSKFGSGRHNQDTFIPEVCPTLRAGGNRTGGDRPPGTDVDTADSLIPETTHTLRAEGFDASEDGTGRGTPLIPEWSESFIASATKDIIAFPEFLSGTQCASTEDLSPSLQSLNPTAIAFNLRGREGGAMPEIDPDNLAVQRAASGGSSRSYIATREVAGSLTSNYGKQPDNSDTALGPTLITEAIAHSIHENQRAETTLNDTIGTLKCNGGKPGQGYPCIMQTENREPRTENSPHYAVRRLTPTECERLQGFPDHHTQIPWRGKPAAECPDGPRYKALGNSMAVPVMHWIGQRIASLTPHQTPSSASPS